MSAQECRTLTTTYMQIYNMCMLVTIRSIELVHTLHMNRVTVLVLFSLSQLVHDLGYVTI
jgi:hypothetical protein